MSGHRLCIMTKSSKTYEMEEILTLATWKVGTIGCAEVGLGDEGIVDFITIELGRNRIVRCYELKITKSDFLSDAKKTFIGEFNYYVIPTELYPEVKNYIEPGIGCVCINRYGECEIKRKPRKRACTMSKGYITARISQALYREHMKYVERDWYDRWTSDSICDYAGAVLHEGDVVEHKGNKWFVKELGYRKRHTALYPYCGLARTMEREIEIRCRPAETHRVS